MILPETPLEGAVVVAEKILGKNERIPDDWAVHGTSGYDFLNDVAQMLVDSTAAEAMTETYEKFIGERVYFEDLVYEKKLLTMRLSLPPSTELDTLLGATR